MGAASGPVLPGTILSHRLVSAGVGGGGGIGITAPSAAARLAISGAPHDALVVATALILIALVASLFMSNVPLRGHQQRGASQAAPCLAGTADSPPTPAT